MNKLTKHSALISFAIGMDALVTDRVHKYYQINIEGWQGGEFYSFLPFLDYTLVWNTGVSYGLLQGLPQYLIMGITGAAFAMLAWWWFTAKTFVVRAGLALALGGALSNIIDRFQYGAVADFFHLHWGANSFFVFNIADGAITLGASLLILDLFLAKKS